MPSWGKDRSKSAGEVAAQIRIMSSKNNRDPRFLTWIVGKIKRGKSCD